MRRSASFLVYLHLAKSNGWSSPGLSIESFAQGFWSLFFFDGAGNFQSTVYPITAARLCFPGAAQVRLLC